MAKVWKKGDPHCPKDAVYIGRGSKFGNPFPMRNHTQQERDRVCDKYINTNKHRSEFIAMVKRELRGKDLVCFCAPLRCHGDWLLEVANS